MKELRKNRTFIVIMLITILSRTVLLGEYPGGIHADEAYSGYEAWSLLYYGMDTWGYKNPVYLTVWGGGMSALNSYLMFPFIALWGLNSITVKLPQVIFGIITVPVFYAVLKRITTEKIANWGSFLLAISPWHIMMSRFGMDANLAPAFLLLAFYFTIRGLEKEKYFIPAALLWGLSLYTYAVIWLFVPFMFAFIVLYGYKHKKVFITKITVASCVILFLMALPLLVFLGVNYDLIPEICTSWISIPKLPTFRGNEVSFKNIVENVYKAVRLLIKQDDGLIWNSTKWFGIYYLYSTPFVIIGAFLYIKKCINNFKEKKFGFELVVLVWFAIAVVVGLLQGINMNRINCIHLSLFILLAVGVEWICNRFGKKVMMSLAGLYLCSFILFEGYYYTGFQEEISERQLAGADAAIEYALGVREESTQEKIYINAPLRHSQILFYTQLPTDDYLSTVKRVEMSEREVGIKSFGCFEWVDDIQENGIYIIMKNNSKEYEEAGFTVYVFEDCAVAVLKRE